MTTLAYLRVSKDTQDTKNQRLAILEFARAERMEVDEFLELQVSSRRSATTRKVDLLLARLVPGDTLLVSELSRLGRSVGEIITLIDTLVTHQIRVFALKEGLRLTGAHDLQTTVIVTLFGLFAEIERTLLSLRTKEALAAAKAGRSPSVPQKPKAAAAQSVSRTPAHTKTTGAQKRDASSKAAGARRQAKRDSGS